MGRPQLDQPNYRLAQRGGRYHIHWWEDDKPRSVSTGQTERDKATVWLN